MSSNLDSIFNAFIEEQLEILENANKQVLNNAINLHRQHCTAPARYQHICEKDFMLEFMMAFQSALAEKSQSIIKEVIIDPRLN